MRNEGLTAKRSFPASQSVRSDAEPVPPAGGSKPRRPGAVKGSIPSSLRDSPGYPGIVKTASTRGVAPVTPGVARTCGRISSDILPRISRSARPVTMPNAFRKLPTALRLAIVTARKTETPKAILRIPAAVAAGSLRRGLTAPLQHSSASVVKFMLRLPPSGPPCGSGARATADRYGR